MEANIQQITHRLSTDGTRLIASVRSWVVSLTLINTLLGWKAHILEMAVVGGSYAAYVLTRGLLFSDLDAKGLQNAGHVISTEKWLGVFWEPGWQSWILDNVEGLILFFNWTYIFTYWPIIIVVGLTLYIINRPRYYYYRTVFAINLIFALLIFMLFPVTSPFNFIDYFVNTIQSLGPSYYGSSEMASYYNTNAAMPSLHFSWTVILGVLFVRTFKGWFKLLGVAYPILTFFAIIITGNHFILDAVAGGALAAAAFAVMELGFRRGLLRRGHTWARVRVASQLERTRERRYGLLDQEGTWERVLSIIEQNRRWVRLWVLFHRERTGVGMRRLLLQQWTSWSRAWFLRGKPQISAFVRRHLSPRKTAIR